MNVLLVEGEDRLSIATYRMANENSTVGQVRYDVQRRQSLKM
jgi:hypothetical protein